MDCDGFSALMYAAYNGHADCVKELLAAGADVNAVDNKGETSLMKAELNGKMTVANLLRAADAVSAEND